MSNNTDYKSTLNLPRTKFSMKAELPKREPFFLKAWQDKNIYQLIRQKLTGRTKYILHDGPPYANGDIHIGHALNKTLKDIIVKFKTMQGFDSAYVPGWDCHGLPVEHQLFKELGITKYQISQIEFRKKAYDYAKRYVSVQKEQFMRLGVFGDWERPYLTLDKEYEYEILKALGGLVRKGFIYRGLKPVNWCPTCETALAEAEVEYEDKRSPSIYVKFKVALSGNNPITGGLPKEDYYLVIWTTTPWTLYGNVAVCAHPQMQYVFVHTEKGNLIIARDLLGAVLKDIGISEGAAKEIKAGQGRELEGLAYEHPFLKDSIARRVVLADYVSNLEGTGLVHLACGHGQEDYLVGLKYNLPIIMPVDKQGRFDNTVKEYSGQNVFDTNKLIIGRLESLGSLLFEGEKQHSYPHCWRCKSAIIFRATKQWFIKIDHRDLRKKLLAAIENDICWVPSSGKERIQAMVESRPDWCLSRQRYWGVPIPSLICSNCQEEYIGPEVIDNFAELVLKEGTDCWFRRDIKDFLSCDSRCPNCKEGNFSKGADILDVWFDSGVSHQAVLKKRKELAFPCDLYLEGSDQHRGWFQSSLIPAMCIDEKAPFRSVLTHGFVVDGSGRKMSKSLGNVISPQDIIKDYGADILRLWAAASNYNEDIRISQEILARLSEAYRKIRNTARFILSNLYDFNPDTDKASYENLKKIDKWILFVLERQVLEGVNKAYDNFEFYKAYQIIYEFCNMELSSFYLDMIKGRLYTSAADSLPRRAAQTVIYETLNVLVRLAAPILVFTADDIWQNMPKERKDNLIFSAHLLDWPVKNPVFTQDDLSGKGQDIFEGLKAIIVLVPDVTERLEEKRAQGLIGSSFDAKINLLTNNEIRYKYLDSLKRDLCEILRVSQVEITLDAALGLDARSRSFPDTAIKIQNAEGTKCVRCWNYSQAVGKDEAHPLICDNCLKAIRGENT